MTIVRVGATEKYSEGWDNAFGKRKGAAPVAKPAKAVAKKSAAKKSVAKVSAKAKPAGKKKAKKKK